MLRDVRKEYKEVFFLKYYYDFSYEEIASMLDVKVNSVKQKLYRARNLIQSKAGGKR